MSEHDHDHPHAAVTDGDEPAVAARARALEELLVSKGAVRREDVRRMVDWLVSICMRRPTVLIALWKQAP